MALVKASRIATPGKPIAAAETGNVERLPFQASEVYAICQAMRPAEAAAAKERSFANLKRGDDVPERENFPFGKEARVRDKIGAFADMSGRTVEKIVQIHEAAEAEPEKYGDVARAYRRLAPPLADRQHYMCGRLFMPRSGHGRAARTARPILPLNGRFHGGRLPPCKSFDLFAKIWSDKA